MEKFNTWIPVISVLIPIISVLISVVASVIITTRRNKIEIANLEKQHQIEIVKLKKQLQIEIAKLRKQLEQQYAKSLFDKRLEVYPQLFKLLSGFNKLIEYNKQTKDALLELQHNLDEWNNEYAILLTTTSAKMAYRYRFYLIDLFQDYSKPETSIPENHWINIRTLNVAFEKSLRAEIGIYDIRAAGILEEEIEKVKKICGEATEKMHRRFDQVENKKGT